MESLARFVVLEGRTFFGSSRLSQDIAYGGYLEERLLWQVQAGIVSAFVDS
jgi:hypothetical protein